MQNQLNVFNDTNVEYQASIQTAIQDAQIAAQKAQKDADLTLQAALQDYTLELQLYQAEVQTYQADSQTEVARYNALLQGKQIDYQWLEGRHAKLKAQYDQTFAMMAPPAPPQQQQAARG